MKKNRIWAAIAAAAILVSCGSKDTTDGLRFETVKATRSVSITSEKGAPQCSVNLQLAAAIGEPSERTKTINAVLAERLLDMEGLSLQQAADSFAGKYTRDYVKNFAPLYREDRNDPEKRSWYEYHYNITGEAHEGREGITVYTATIDYYEGGAHGINQRLVMNFDNETGKLLTLSDVFIPGYEQALNDLLQKALIEKVDAKDIDDLHAKGYLYSMDMFAPENFVMGEDNITFIYNPYEIAPYAMGLVELTISNSELEDLEKKRD